VFLKLKKLFSTRLFTGLLLILLCIVLSGCDAKMADDLDITNEYINSVRGCWTCQFYVSLFNTAGRITNNVYDPLRSIALMLLGGGLFGWLIVKTGSLFLSLREPNLAKFWLEIIKTVGLAMIVALILIRGDVFNELIASFLQPIIDIFLNFALMIVDQSLPSKIPNDLRTGTDFIPVPGMTVTIGMKLELLIYKVSVALNVCRIMGLRMMMIGGFMSTVLGLVTVCLFFFLVIIFPLFIIDGVLRFAFVMILLPLFLVCWVFPATRGYFKKAWNMFLSAFAQMMVCCIFISLAVCVMETFFDLRGYNLILSPVIQEINPDIVSEMSTLSVTNLSFLIMIYFLYNSAQSVMKIAGFLAGAPGTSIMDKVARGTKEAIKAATWAAVAVVAASVGAGGVAQKALEKAKEHINNAKDQVT